MYTVYAREEMKKEKGKEEKKKGKGERRKGGVQHYLQGVSALEMGGFSSSLAHLNMRGFAGAVVVLCGWGGWLV